MEFVPTAKAPLMHPAILRLATGLLMVASGLGAAYLWIWHNPAGFAREDKLAVWNEQFAQPPEPEKREVPSSLAERRRFFQSLARIQIWILPANPNFGTIASIPREQMRSLFGQPPLLVRNVYGKGYAPCYLDKNLNLVLLADGSRDRYQFCTYNATDIDPDLLLVRDKFHLKESMYVRGIYGLDPRYSHEQIKLDASYKPLANGAREVGTTDPWKLINKVNSTITSNLFTL